MAHILKCKTLICGLARGEILFTDQNISFWGGVDPATGKVIDPRHVLFGQAITNRVLAFPYGKGSAAAPLVMLELAKQGTAPAAMINIETDPLLVAGPVISKHFYGVISPLVTLAREDFDQLQLGGFAIVDGLKEEVIVNP